MPRITALDTILAGKLLRTAYRILTVSPTWPDGDPPYTGGQYVRVPAIPGNVAVPQYQPSPRAASYWRQSGSDIIPMPTGADETAWSADSADIVPNADQTLIDAFWRRDGNDLIPRTLFVFDASAWVDVTGVVAGYHYVQDIDQQCDVLSLTVPATWRGTDLDKLFRSMRVIVLQERYTGVSGDSGWVTVATCLSTGYTQNWQPGGALASWTVNALDAMMLAGLDIIGSGDGADVYSADLVKVGTAAVDGRYTMILVEDAVDAWEFAVTADGTATGPIQPNWSDRPAPQFWCHNVPGTSAPIPIAVGGEAVQAVFGEGKLRIGKVWAHTSPGDAKDYSAGLGFPEGTVPDIRGALYRYAHPAMDSLGQTVPSDLGEDIAQLDDPPIPGQVTVAGDLSGLPAELTLVLLDGSNLRYQTADLVYDAGSDTTTIELTLASATVPTGTYLRYGEANRATDFVTRLLLDAGYQKQDATAPLYVEDASSPQLDGADVPIILPPFVAKDSDKLSRLEALSDLRRRYAVIPSWLTRATPDGRIISNTVNQAFDTATAPNAAIIPLWHTAGLEVDRTDLNIYTKVVAYGRARQVLDLTQGAYGGTVAAISAANGGLPDVSAYNTVTIYPDGYTPLAVTLDGVSAYTLADWFYRGKAPSISGHALRAFAWYYVPEVYDSVETAAARLEISRQLADAWRGKYLAEITLGDEPVMVSGLELNVSNSWYTDRNDWGGNRHGEDIYYRNNTIHTAERVKRAHADGQVISWEYWDVDQTCWRPLASNIYCALTVPLVINLGPDDFDIRQEVATTKLRLRCDSPFWAECGMLSNEFHSVIGVWLSQVKVFSGETVRGVAEIGVDAPFTGAAWDAIRDRMRRRTFVVPDIADWAQTQAQCDALALEWLYTTTRNLAPRAVADVRPDVMLGDTVRMITPYGQATHYTAGAGQTSAWYLYGVKAGNTDDGLLYWSLTWNGADPSISIYKDSARTQLIAAGSRTGNGVLPFTPRNNSSISGFVTVAAAYSPESETGSCGLPTHLVTAVERSGQAGEPSPIRLTLVDYTAPYFDE